LKNLFGDKGKITTSILELKESPNGYKIVTERDKFISSSDDL